MGLVNLNCPGCGHPISLDESREYGFCTYCGTQIMVDKTIVEHKGSVKIDNSEFVQKFLENARRALDKQDWEEVEKYYNLVEQNAPHNMEAVFFSSFGKAMDSLVSQDYYKRQQIFQVLNRSISVINDYYEETDEDKRAVLETILKHIKMMSTLEFVSNAQLYASDVGSKKWTCNLIKSAMQAFLEELKQIQAVHQNETFIQAMISETETAISGIDSGGCYIATCVYGSYDCPQVWTLRRFRDNTLAATWYGRTFIRLYYAVSPKLVKRFGQTNWFKRIWKGKLDGMVKRLREEGIEDTPYQDKAW